MNTRFLIPLAGLSLLMAACSDSGKDPAGTAGSTAAGAGTAGDSTAGAAGTAGGDSGTGGSGTGGAGDQYDTCDPVELPHFTGDTNLSVDGAMACIAQCRGITDNAAATKCLVDECGQSFVDCANAELQVCLFNEGGPCNTEFQRYLCCAALECSSVPPNDSAALRKCASEKCSDQNDALLACSDDMQAAMQCVVASIPSCISDGSAGAGGVGGAAGAGGASGAGGAAGAAGAAGTAGTGGAGST